MLIIYIILIIYLPILVLSQKTINKQIQIFKYPYKLYKLTDYESAKCLDGSSPGYYFSKATRISGLKKYLIFLDGGGWCGDTTIEKTLQNCYQRSFTDLGSSLNYPDKIDSMGGIMSSEQSVNPFFYEWNKIFVNYCDGTGRQGYNTEPYIYNNTKIWFRGMNNTISLFQDLIKKFNFLQAEEVGFLGVSSGGLAVYTWTNYLRELLPQKTKLWTVSDSGFFLDYQNTQTQTYLFRTYFQNFMYYSNRESDPVIPECVRDYPTEKWKCLFAQYMQQYISVPIFLAQFEYDSWQIPNILSEYCYNNPQQMNSCNYTQTENIELFRFFTMQQVIESVNLTKNRGVWFPACFGHGLLRADQIYNNINYTVLEHSQNTAAFTIYKWSNNISDDYDFKYIDPMPWPSNQPCSFLNL